MSGRDAAGRFAPGFSPDRGRGRLAAATPITFHASLRASVMMVANAPTVVRNGAGRRRTVPLFEALLLRLATGQTSRRTSPTAFLRLVIDCAPLTPLTPAPAQETEPALSDAESRLITAMSTGADEGVCEAVTAYMQRLRRASRDFSGA